MIKVGMEFKHLEEEVLLEVAQNLQRFIVEDDYAIATIIQKLQAKKMVVLDVTNEENMPDLATVLESFDEEEIEYKLFREKNNDWDLCELSDLDLERDRWLNLLIGTALIGYFIFSFFEIFAIYDWFTIKYEMNSFVAMVVSAITAFVPIVGSVFAYFGATELWHWNSILTLFLYFWYYLPLIGFIFYLLWLIFWIFFKEKWYDFWNPEFKR